MREGWRRAVLELKLAGRHDDALVIVQEAIKAGHMAAHVMLARMADHAGLSRQEAGDLIDYVEANMDPKDIEAHLELSVAYDVMLGNIAPEEKPVRRVVHLLKACELGAGAVHSLALARTYLAGGLGVGANETEAVRWYKRAIEQGSIEAATELQKVYKRQARSKKLR